MTRHMAEKQADTCLNFLLGEPLGKEMHGHDECRIGIPVGEVERNLVGVENLLIRRVGSGGEPQ